VSVRFLTDVHVRQSIIDALRANGIDVLTAQEAGLRLVADPVLLDEATRTERVLVTEDRDFLRESAGRLKDGRPFSTILRIKQRQSGDAACIRSLLFFSLAAEPHDLNNHILYLPF
jgi:predicted nuclease of predicted toxin-antitoxin system